MQRIIAFAFVLTTCINLPAQPGIVATATDCITHNKFAEANRYLDSILMQNPETVDALMMKGNVLLNQAWNNSTQSYFNIERAESVFDTSAIDINFFITIIPADTSVKVEQYWRQCLKIDSTRTDIKKGLCNLYSLSLRTAELKKQLKQMQGIITANEENAYQYAEYARNLKIRGRFDDAMQVYGLIADMFPGLAGIRCDMANEYFYKGQNEKALNYLDSTLSQKEVDPTSFINAAAVYSMLNHYNEAYHTFKRYSEKDTLLEADFYNALLMFARNDSGFYRQMAHFIDAADEQSYFDEIRIARKLLPYSHTPFTIDDLKALQGDEKIPRYYKVLILQRGVTQLSDCVSDFYAGSFYAGIKNYQVAKSLFYDALFQERRACNLLPEGQINNCRLYYCYCLLQLNEPAMAQPVLNQLFTCNDAFVQQAAKYFAAKNYLAKGKKSEATKLLTEVATAKEQTKYAWLAKSYLMWGK